MFDTGALWDAIRRLQKDLKCKQRCLGISSSGDATLVLNQQGDWVSGGGGSISEPNQQVVFGTGSGVTSSEHLKYDDNSEVLYVGNVGNYSGNIQTYSYDGYYYNIHSSGVGSGKYIIQVQGLNSDLTWSLPLTSGSDGSILTTDGNGNLSWNNNFTKWQKITITYSDLAVASTSSEYLLLTLPASNIVMDCKMIVTQNFTGGSLSNYQITIGTDSQHSIVHSNINAFSGIDDLGVGGSPVSTVFNLSGTTPIKLFISSTGDNLNAATQGSVNIYILIGELP